MIKEITEYSVHIVTDEHKIGEECYCDRCDKLIYTDKYENKPKIGLLYIQQPYFSVTTGHHDWGNDSCDSVDVRDICSEECLKAEFDDYLECEDDTKYIEIERLHKAVLAAEVKL